MTSPSPGLDGNASESLAARSLIQINVEYPRAVKFPTSPKRGLLSFHEPIQRALMLTIPVETLAYIVT